MGESQVALDAASAAELSRRERLAFVDGAAAYEANMAEAGRADRQALLALANLQPGRSLLDVCTGPGWLAIEAVQQSPGLTATGVDLSPAMVQLAQAAADAAGVGATFAVMDAARLEFPDASFDRVTCGWGLMHVPDPAAALEEMARVTRSGGLLATSVWGPASQTVQGVLAEALRTGADGRAALDYGYVTRLGDESRLVEVLEQATWRDPAFEVLRGEFVVPDAGFVWAAMATGTTFGTLVGDLDESDQAAARAEFLRRCEPYRQADGIHVPMSQLLVTARR
jgi:ubiquinone/menaquinone biosynthesis C-methylase UbiE